MSRSRLIALLLTLGTLAVFLPVSRFGFVNYDDNDYITNNPVVQNGLTWAGVRWAFTTFHASNWHPLTWLSHMTDCTLFGLNPGAQHLVNALFHATNAALLFVLLLRLTNALWPCAFMAALFAWHPLHVESVAWISERKDVLSTFFALLSLLSYTRFVKQNCRRSFWFALVFFTLGLLAKPMLVTLPLVMLLLDFWPLQRFNGSTIRRLLTEKIPFFAFTIISCVVTFFAQRNGDAVVSLAKVSLPYRLENAPVAVAGYLCKLFWPVNLCVFYPTPEKIPALQVFFALTALLLISVIAWHWRQTRPFFLMGWLWFLGTLVPVIGLVQVGGQAMADRYSYIPSIGIFIAVTFGALALAEKFHLPKTILAAASVLLLGACLILTEKQLSFWRDSETLFRRAAAVTQNNDVAHVNLGVTLDAQGRFEESLNAYHQAVKSGTKRYQVYNNLGNVLGLLGRHTESLAEYRKAIQLAPNNATLHNAAGGQLVALGRLAEASKEFLETERLNTNYAAPHVENAKVLFKLGRDDDGLDEFRAALRIEPDNYQTLATTAHYLAANKNAAARDGKSALFFALNANELSGHTQPMVLDILGMAYAENGDFTNAIACAQSALELANAVQLKNAGPMQTRLELYKNQQPWRESFRVTNAVANQ